MGWCNTVGWQDEKSRLERCHLQVIYSEEDGGRRDA